MIHLPASVRVYLCLTPCDMRNYVLFIVMRSLPERHPVMIELLHQEWPDWHVELRIT